MISESGSLSSVLIDSYQCVILQAKRSLKNKMPQIFKIENQNITVKCHFIGFRRFPLLKWVPFFTGNEPRVHVYIESRENRIKNITVNHQKPDGSMGKPEFEVRDLNTPNFGRKINLRQLTEPGSHEYLLGVDTQDGTAYMENLFSTGKVPYWDSVVQVIVIIILTLLLEHSIPFLWNLIKSSLMSH